MTRNTLIWTKLQRPAIGHDILPRTELIESLENGRHRKLTLISAPAGYGKSILASLWQEACSCQSVWLTLDKNDNDLAVFLDYFIHAVQTIYPDAFPQTQELLNGLQFPTLDIVSTILINETAVLSQPCILVLDDYHVITNQAINQLIDTLIQYLPAQMHLVLISRQDPPLDIINLRAKNQVTDIRLAELRFNKEETTHYLDNELGANVLPDFAHKLFQHTGGWAAVLRLVVLAWRSHTDQDLFIETFQGTNQYVMSYLVSEVLSHQSPSVQTFLLQTSLLDRFCAPLCDALLGSENLDVSSSQIILERLHRDDLFLIPLDQHGEWFRYHHLFQDLLRHQLQLTVSRAEISQLHIRASSWLGEQGFIEEAVDHGFLADNMDQAAQIVSQARFDLMRQTQWQHLEQLLRRMPQDLIDRYPDLLMAEIWLIYHHNQFTKLPPAIKRLQRLISQRAEDGKDYSYLVGEMSAIGSLLSYYALDIDGAILQAEQALKLTSPELGIVRVLARLILAGTRQLAGDVNDAYTTIYRGFDEEPYQSDALKAAVLVTACFVGWIAADITLMQQNARQVIKLSQQSRSPGMLSFGHYFLGMAAYQQNDLSAAETHFAYVNQRPFTSYDDSFVYSSCGLALTYQVLGREQEALEVVEKILAYLLVTGNSDMLPVVQAFQAKLALRQGKLRLASQWANRQDQPAPLSPLTQFYAPQMTLATLWLAENTPASRVQAASLLAQLEDFLASTHNNTFLIECLALQAILYQLEQDETAALIALERALALALPAGIVRPFVDLGLGMGTLLYKLAATEPELANFKQQILTAMPSANSQQVYSGDGDNGSQPLIEPLTNREMDVLALLCQRQTDKEIASRLVISPSTVRSHIKNIYSKLGVNNRRLAAIRAQELGLVSVN